MQGTKLTYEEQIDHYKGDSYFTMAPSTSIVQESDGTKVSLLASYQSFTRMATAHHGRICRQQRLQHHQHGQFDHDPLCQPQRRLADHRSGMQRRQQLCRAISRRGSSSRPRSSGCKAPASRTSR